MAELQNNRWTFRDALKVVSAVIASLVLLYAITLLLPIRKYFEAATHPSLFTIFFLILQEAIFMAPIYIVIIHGGKAPWRLLGLRWIGTFSTIKWVLKAYGLVILIQILIALFLTRFQELPFGFQRQESHIPLFGTSAMDIWIAVVGLVFIAPIVEEIFFRGFLFQTFLKKFRPALAAIFSAVLFAAIHLELQSIGLIIILALVLTWLFYRSKSLWPGIIFHMTNNALAFFLEWLVSTGQIKI